LAPTRAPGIHTVLVDSARDEQRSSREKQRRRVLMQAKQRLGLGGFCVVNGNVVHRSVNTVQALAVIVRQKSRKLVVSPAMLWLHGV